MSLFAWEFWQGSSGGVTVAVGPASENDSAQALVVKKSVAIGQASELDTAGSTPHAKSVTIGHASEADGASVVNHARSVALGGAQESDSAHAVTPLEDISVLIGTASETDFAGRVVGPSPVPHGGGYIDPPIGSGWRNRQRTKYVKVRPAYEQNRAGAISGSMSPPLYVDDILQTPPDDDLLNETVELLMAGLV